MKKSIHWCKYSDRDRRNSNHSNAFIWRNRAENSLNLEIIQSNIIFVVKTERVNGPLF